jgi:hypothetical protein
VSGSLDSVADTTFRLEFFASVFGDPSGHGEGQTLIGSTDVTTNGSCTATFGPLSFPLPVNQRFISSTATRLDSGGNPIETSEFSANVWLIPTAANASISGRILTPLGRGIANAIVTATDMEGNQVGTTNTNVFGFYTVRVLPVGGTYIVTPQAKRYRFEPSSYIITLDDDFNGMNFVAGPLAQ